MKIGNALSIGAEMLPRSDSAEFDARLLLEHALSVPRSYLIAHDTDTLTTDQINAYLRLITRAERGEPIPYIIGSIPFRHADIRVTPAVLIPRPETEQLVDLALRWAKGKQNLRVLDVGTGSGCVAISLAQELDKADVTAVEISAEALTIAQQNGIDNGVTVNWCAGSLLEPVTGRFDLIIANLPYVAESERDLLGDGTRDFEPHLALFGGADGLDLVRDLLAQARNHLVPNGAIMLEIGFQQGQSALALAQNAFPEASTACLPDYAGNDRFISIVLR